jgi:hypothetical protein
MPLTNAETLFLQGWVSFFNGAGRPPASQTDKRKGWDKARATSSDYGGYGKPA